VLAPDIVDDRVKLTLELLATVCGKLDRTGLAAVSSIYRAPKFAHLKGLA